MLKKISFFLILTISFITITAHADSRDDALKKAKDDVSKQEQVLTTAHDTLVRKASSANRARAMFEKLANLEKDLKDLPKTEDKALETAISQKTQDLHQLGETALRDYHAKDNDYKASRKAYQKEHHILNQLKKHLYNIVHNRY